MKNSIRAILVISLVMLISFTNALSQVITSFAPTFGCSGTSVTIKGTGLLNATSVSFGGTPASNFTIINDATILATVGSAASGTISVTTISGTVSSTGSFTVGTYESYAYIANFNDNNVKVINTATNTVTATIAVGTHPIGVSASDDGAKVAVTNQGSNNVSIINTSTNTVSATVAVGVAPTGICFSKDGLKLFVTNQTSNVVNVINTETNIVTNSIATGSGPRGICISNDGAKVYVANELDNSITVINTTTNTVVATLTGFSSPVALCVNLDNTKLYVTNRGNATVTVINASTNTAITTIAVGNNPYGIVLNADNTKAYVANYGSNTISIINTTNNTVDATLPVGSNPYGISINNFGGVFVSNYSSNNVSVVNTSNNTVSSTISVGNAPHNLGNFVANIPITCSSLPIQLVSFEVKCNSMGNIIFWQTSSEINSLKFVIEKSTDGRLFTEIGLLNAKGAGNYSFTDNSTNNLTCYYRLKMVDKDGSYSLSRILEVVNYKKDNFTIFPNPVKGILHLQIAHFKDESAVIQILDISGKVLYQQSVLLINGKNNLVLPVSKLQSGNYMIVIKGYAVSRKYFTKY